MLEFRENPTGFTVYVTLGDNSANYMEFPVGKIGRVPQPEIKYWYEPEDRTLYAGDLRQIADKLEELNNENR